MDRGESLLRFYPFLRRTIFTLFIIPHHFFTFLHSCLPPVMILSPYLKILRGVYLLEKRGRKRGKKWKEKEWVSLFFLCNMWLHTWFYILLLHRRYLLERSNNQEKKVITTCSSPAVSQETISTTRKLIRFLLPLSSSNHPSSYPLSIPFYLHYSHKKKINKKN